MFSHDPTTLLRVGPDHWSNGLSLLIVGILILRWPAIVPYFVAGFLMISGLIGITMSGDIYFAAATIMIGLLILLFPQLVSYFYAFYLVLFSTFLFSRHHLGAAFFSFMAASVLIFFPKLVSYTIAAYFMLQGLVILLLPLSTMS